MANVEGKVELEKVTGISPDNTFMRIADGRAMRAMGGLQFYAQGENGAQFALHYDDVKVVRDASGAPVWVNSKSKGEFPGHTNKDNWSVKGTYFVEVYQGTDVSHVPLRTVRDLEKREAR